MVHPRRRRQQQTAATPMTSSSSSLLLLILHHLRLCWNYLLSFLRSGGGGNNNTRIISLTNLLFQSSSSQRKQLTFDNGTQVTIGEQIAEGGFSYVFEAFPANSSTKRRYALKRINCADQELLQSCRHEAGIHRSLPSNKHPNLLELLGLKFEQDLTSSSGGSSVGSSLIPEEYNVCYMLFPYLPNSLRGEITNRNILNQDNPSDGNNNHYRYNNTQTTRRQREPFTTVEVMHLFRGILDALLAMHNANISHRDVKLERSYRPPELSDVGNLSASNSCIGIVDYGKVDVWSLGCVLFRLMHGASPFEMEFVKNDYGGDYYGYGRRRSGASRKVEEQHQQYGFT